MSDSDFGFGVDCIKYRHTLMKSNHNIFEYNYLGGIIDIEKKRMGCETLLDIVVKYLLIIIKYVLMFLISKIDYLLIGFLIYILIFKIIIPLFYAIIIPMRDAVCAIANFTLPSFRIPSVHIPVADITIGGQLIGGQQPLKGLMEPITRHLDCPAESADELFSSRYGTCLQRFGRVADGCNGSYATDFTLYQELEDGSPNTSKICNSFVDCPNAPVNHLIQDSILSDFAPMMGYKGINFGSAPFKYLECCKIQGGCNTEDKDNAIHAVNNANKFPDGFTALPEIDYNDRNPFDFYDKEKEPFNTLTNYSITTKNFAEPSEYNKTDKNCVSTSIIDRGISWYDGITTYLKICIWCVILLLLFVQIHNVVRRIYNGYIIQDKFSKAMKSTTKSNDPHTNINKMHEDLPAGFDKTLLKICDPEAGENPDITDAKYQNYKTFIECIDKPLDHTKNAKALETIDSIENKTDPLSPEMNIISKVKDKMKIPAKENLNLESSKLNNIQLTMFVIIFFTTLIIVGIVNVNIAQKLNMIKTNL